MRLFGWLTLAAAVAACSRSELDVDPLGVEGGPSCASDAGVAVGTPARTLTTAQAGASVIDPDDDLLVVFGGEVSSGTAAKSIGAVKLGTGEPVAIARAGDSSVALGPNGRAVWDALNHRVVVLGDGLSFYDPSAPPDLSQVFAAKIQGATAVLSSLPKFPGGETSDVALAAAIDPIAHRLLVVPEKGSQAGPIETWALDLASDQWSTFDEDAKDAVQNVQISSLVYDAASRRMIGAAADTMWALSLDSPSGWTKLDGTVPPAIARYASVIGPGPSLIWDDDLCAFVVAFTDDECLYQVWRADVSASSFTMTALGVQPQTRPDYSRGMGAFDARRRNFVFGSGFDCDEHDYVAASTDFLPVKP